MQLDENFIRTVSKKTGISRDLLEDIWNECVRENEGKSKYKKSDALFWKGVRNLFENKIKDIDIMEAKRIMKEREDMYKSIEGVLNDLGRDDYTSAQKNMRTSVEKCLNTMINRRAEAYLKEKGAEIRKRAKEV